MNMLIIECYCITDLYVEISRVNKVCAVKVVFKLEKMEELERK